MAGFLTPLHLEYLDGISWKVLAPFEYRLGAPDGTESILVPFGFVTDFASVPRVLWTLLPPTGPYGKAAVIHDWLYHYRRILPQPRFADRSEADRIFNEAMQVLQVGRWTRWTVYLGVRTSGWQSWSDYRRKELR